MRSDTVFSTSSLQAYLSLVMLCGIALALSIPPAARISSLRVSDVSYPPGLFHIAFILLFGLFSINQGAIIAANISSRLSRLKLVFRFAAHIAYGLAILSPYLVFSRTLMPSGTAGLIALILYTAISSLFFGLASFHLELRSGHRKQSAFLLRYSCYAAFCVVPFITVLSHSSLLLFLSVSPVGFATRIIGGASAMEVITGFFIPLLGILWILTRRQRFNRRPHAV